MASSLWLECGATRWLHMDPGAWGVAGLLTRYALLWAGLFYGLVFLTSKRLLRLLPRSQKPEENRALPVAHTMFCAVKAGIVSGLANYALLESWHQPLDQQYAGEPKVYLAGVLFTSFELAELVMVVHHRQYGGLMVIHHLIHLGLGWVIIANCGPHMIAAILMAQETSTVALNVWVLARHRTSPGHWLPALVFNLFSASFVLWRLGLGTFGTVHYLQHYPELLLPRGYPLMHARMLAAGVVQLLGSTLQWFWGMKNFLAVFSKFINPTKDDVQKSF